MFFVNKKLISVLMLVGLVIASLGCRHKKVVDNEWQNADQTADMVKSYKNDTAITVMIKEEIMEDPNLRLYHINVQTANGVVRLTGFVNSKQSSNKVVSIVEAVKGVNSVSNSLIIQ